MTMGQREVETGNACTGVKGTPGRVEWAREEEPEQETVTERMVRDATT
jgi:hypothetical protein